VSYGAYTPNILAHTKDGETAVGDDAPPAPQHVRGAYLVLFSAGPA